MANANNNPLFKHNAITEEFRRSNHPDFKTTSELKQAGFSGVRNNSITLMIEFWIDGTIDNSISMEAARSDPDLVRKTHMRVFAMGAGPDDLVQ